MAPSTSAIPLILVEAAQLRDHYGDRQAWFEVNQFQAKPGSYCLLPAADGSLEAVLVGKPEALDPWTLAALPSTLPTGQYKLGTDMPDVGVPDVGVPDAEGSSADQISPDIATQLELGWRLGQYRFDRYRNGPAHSSTQNEGSQPTHSEATITQRSPAELVVTGSDSAYVEAATAATYLVRDLINTPVNDMGPAELQAAASAIAQEHGMELTAIVGEDLLTQNYPMVHAVGRASASSPRVLDLRWGSVDAPKVTLVGKGVCFDTGGLNMKSGAGMKLMKKDMGGAAQVLGLAKLIAATELPVRLRVLVGAVENSVSSNAMRPTDVIASRKGITVENNNTDAEGRLVLGDILWEGSSEKPELVIDCATLTGAARVALGTELPAFFCNNANLAQALMNCGSKLGDPFWQLPLHQSYRSMLDSKVADISNISSGSFGGAITAALFLQEFVKPGVNWIHVDFMAWNLRTLPGRPEGGEAMGMRALYELIRTQVLSSSGASS